MESAATNTTHAKDLDHPDIQQSIEQLIHNLPAVEQALTAVKDAVDFGEAVLQDKRVHEAYESNLELTNINEDTLHALVTLLEKLPLLADVVTRLEEMLEFGATVLSDEQTVQNVMETLNEYVAPYKESLTRIQALKDDIKEQAEQQTSTITVFTIMKWLKDENIQKGLRYVQATIDVLSEKHKL
ncbi:hypothetical protein [Lentibacillus saliphilus]|uniref:hypothetical protein n=1 Tax=Lentibacillus saliphilus TaxID=2737028 RepID=UPI001C304BF6|nr:hypothetical protein [Lentibacillus saliphilus]